MIDHLSLQCGSVEDARRFYLTTFAALGIGEIMVRETDIGPVVGLGGADGFPRLWLGPLVDDGRRPVHLALTAPSRDAVDQVHRAAVESGAEILHEPRIWPEYHPGYYGVFLRDPDGNNLEAVHHTW